MAALRPLRDPVVGLIHASADDDALDHRVARHGDRRVRNDKDPKRSILERVALGDAINFVLHRTGISVDVEGDGFRRKM
jgi:hypothetical protein